MGGLGGGKGQSTGDGSDWPLTGSYSPPFWGRKGENLCKCKSVGGFSSKRWRELLLESDFSLQSQRQGHVLRKGR